MSPSCTVLKMVFLLPKNRAEFVLLILTRRFVMSESRRERRKAGVTFFKALRAARELSRDEDFEFESEEQFAEAVLEKLVGGSNPKGSMPEADWGAFLEFIMNLLPIILKILALF